MSRCSSCGAALVPQDRFCGSCGARVPETVTAAPAPLLAAPPSGANVLGWGLAALGLGIAVAAIALVVSLTTPADSGDGDRASRADGGVTSASRASPEGLAPLPRGASEVDRPADFAYVAAAPSCAGETRITDELKQVALAVDAEVRRGVEVSWEDERALGERTIREFTKSLGGRLVDGGAVPDYLAAVAEPFLARVERDEVPYRFYMWEGTDVENALAVPGGHIVISAALYERWLHNEAQLATVLGHEIGHVDLRHSLAVFEVLRSMGVPDDDVVSQALVHLARLPYSSAVEEQADRYGAERLHRVGYSVFQSVALWDRIAEENPSRVGTVADARKDPLGAMVEAALGELENLVTTHPAPARRACLLKRLAHDLYADEPRAEAYVGTTNLRRRVSMSRRAF